MNTPTSTAPMAGASAVKAIVLDYGGTIDCRGDHWSHIIYEAYQRAGLELSRDAFDSIYVAGEKALAGSGVVQPSDNFLTLMQHRVEAELSALEAMGVSAGINSDTAAQIAQYCYSYARGCVDTARTTLQTLASKYPMAVASNFPVNLRAVLTDFGIADLFRAILASEVEGVRKPDAQLLARAIEALGATPTETLMVGDSLTKDIAPARQLGCLTVLIKGRGWTEDVRAQVTPDATITDLEQLPSLLGISKA